jgi:ribosome-associated translation inhibitor RaiA
MDYQLRAHAVRLSQRTRDYAEEKLVKAVNKVVGKEGSRLDVEITDLAQGTGAPTYRVSVHVHVPHIKPHVVTVQDPEPRAAIDLASEKIFRALTRTLGKKRTRRHSKGDGIDALSASPESASDDAEDAGTATL